MKNTTVAIWRILKGMFLYPAGRPPSIDEVLIIKGDPDASPRSAPDQRKWIVLSAPHPAPFLVSIEINKDGFYERHTRKIRTPFVAIRVRPHDLEVVALSLGGHGPDSMKLDVFLPTATEGEIRNKLALKHLTYKVTWV